MLRALKTKRQEIFLFLLIFIAVFFSSILGGRVFGLSLNKLALLPLEMYIVYYIITRKKLYSNRHLYPLFAFLIIQILSSAFGLIFFQNPVKNYNNRLITNILQNIFIYFPILFGLGLIKSRFPIFKYFKIALLWVVRIHCIWAIIQFLLWSIFSLNINDILFNNILNGFIEVSLDQILVNINGYTYLRAAGFTIHVAFAALMVLGVCFDEKFYLKILYCVVCVLSMSRTGIVATFGVLFFQLIYLICVQEKEKRLKIIYNILIFAGIAIAVCLLLYFTVPFVRTQVNNVLGRFFNITSNKDGSMRHVMYPIYAIYSWVVDLNFFQKLWGVGARVSGLVFVESNYVSQNMIFNAEMLSTAWEVECDIAAILLGDGLLGFVAYIFMLYKLVRSKKCELMSLGLGLFAFGVMSAVFSNTLILLTMIFVFVSFEQKTNMPVEIMEREEVLEDSAIDLSVIIVSYKNIQILRDCLDSIKKYNDIGSRLEVIVSDNSEDNLLYDTIKAEYNWIKIIKNKNNGFGAGNNRGFEISRGKYLLFLNPDTILVEPIFDFTVKKFEENYNLGLFGIKLIDVNRKATPSFFNMDAYGIFATIFVKFCRKTDFFIEGEFFLAGADLFVRRKTFIQAGLFDENIFMYKEEADLIKRIQLYAESKEVSYFNKKRLIHLEGGTQEKSIETKYKTIARIIQTDKYYSVKWGIELKKVLKAKRRYEKFKWLCLKLLRKTEGCIAQQKIIDLYTAEIKNIKSLV